MEYKVVKVVFEGKIDCEHEESWTYSKIGKLMMTLPSIVIANRICKSCGRVETIRYIDIEKFEVTDEYMKTYVKFHATDS